jgi:endonuclease YncB( thermonuclease family)
VRKLLFVTVIFFLVACSNAQSETYCKVTRVLDGDTFHCLPNQSISNAKVHKDGTVSIRMRGIDAPEKRQSYGMEAKESLKELIGGQTVKLDIKDIDRYGRVVAYVILGQVNVNLEQVKRGYAWAYTEFLDRPYMSEFYSAEKEARSQRLGLWKESNPMPPWEWRKLNRK